MGSSNGGDAKVTSSTGKATIKWTGPTASNIHGQNPDAKTKDTRSVRDIKIVP